jgi:hypothetical protein
MQQMLRDKGQFFPESAEEMKTLVSDLSELDCDQDGVTNGQEIADGSYPGESLSFPAPSGCESGGLEKDNPMYDLCDYDHNYVYRKIWHDFCGVPPSWDDYQEFKELDTQSKTVALDSVLEECLDSRHWLGKDGVVWKIGYYKIRPVGSVKAGEDEGLLPIVDYYADFNLFVYSQIDGNDAREQLLADYTVTRSGGNGSPIQYTKQAPNRLLDGQVMQPEYRVGLLTTFWNLGFYLNYTGVARVLAAQAFRAYLGITMSEMEGLIEPPVEDSKFKDYDQKGVDRPECAVCHRTVDPLSYPFRNYNGLTGTSSVLQGQNASGLSSVENLGTKENLTPLSYSLPRMDYFEKTTPGISEMPEAGYILGQRVENLQEWAEVLVNSDQFAANTVRDYWRVIIGHEPLPDEQKEFKRLWQDFKTVHNYSVEAMLYDLIRTKAYGVP